MSFACDLCDNQFTARKNLYRHVRGVHDVVLNIRTTQATVKCPQNDCSFCSKDLAGLRVHVQEEHMTVIEERELRFQSRKDFFKWKTEEEEKTKSCFVQHRGARRINNGGRVYRFLCNRTGKFSSRSEGKRSIKSQGSAKMGSHCTAEIKLCQERNGVCQVVYFSTHFGHIKHLGFLKIPLSEREAIAGRIEEGVSFQRILDDVRDNIHSYEVKRVHLLTRQDLRNVRRDFALGDSQRHRIDEVSVHMWTTEMRECVLLFKREGEEMNNFEKTDFMLVLMSDAQRDLLRRFGSTVCVDSTYNTNMYKLLLTTLLIIDDFGMGIPVSFCISNSETTSVMTNFFRAVRDKAGVIQASTFMSDDTNTFRSAWSCVMGNAANNLLCTWHVDRSWRNNLKKVHGLEKQIVVYKGLRMLLEEANVETFTELLQLFIWQLEDDADTEEFAVYFLQNYYSRPQLWAYCHRLKLGINTNMHIESMHRVLKYCYLQGKVNNRLDKLLSVLMKMVRDKLFERLVKLYKGGNSHRNKLITTRHKSAGSISSDMISALGGGRRYTVASQTKVGEVYTVTMNDKCELACRLRCVKCNICIHTFSCSCPDNLIHLNICKHIHAVCMKYICNDGVQQAELNVDEESSVIFCALKTPNEELVCNAKVRRIQATLQAVIAHVSRGELDAKVLDSVEETSERLLSLCRSESKSIVPRGPSNKKLIAQRMPVKQKKRQQSKLMKPTTAEKSQIVEQLIRRGSGVACVNELGTDDTY